MTTDQVKTFDWRARLQAPARRVIAWAKDRPDRRLLLSNESGRARVYAWDGRSAPQLLPPEAKPGYTFVSPDGASLYYVKDAGDSEVGSVMWLPWGPDAPEPEPLAPDLPALYVYGLQVGRDGTVYFAGAGQGRYRIYRVDRSGARVLYEHQNEAYLPFLSEDERLLAFCTSEPANNRHWQATVVDARDGRRVAQLSDGDAYAVSPGYWMMAAADVRPWSPAAGDARLLFTSNASGRPVPGIWNVATGERRDLAADLPGEVTPVGWAPDAGSVIVNQELDGRSRLWRHDVASGELRRLQHSAGTLQPLPAFPDGSLWYAYQSVTEPLQMRAVQLGTAGAGGDQAAAPAPSQGAPQRAAPEAGEPAGGAAEVVVLPPSAPGGGQPWESVRYRSGDGTEIHGFLGLPDGAGPFPAVLVLHGGPTAHVADAYAPTWQSLVAEGYAVFAINFRGSTGYGRAFQEQINGRPGHWELMDMAAARAYLIERAVAIPDRVMLFGGSYGGYLTLMGLTRQPELWRAGFAYVPLCDFLLMYEDANQRLKGWARTLLGGPPEGREDHYRNCSPLAQVARLRAPVAIVAHRSDTRCPIRQVEQFVARLRELGVPHEYLVLEGGHGTRSLAEAIANHERLLAFATRHVRPRAA